MAVWPKPVILPTSSSWHGHLAGRCLEFTNPEPIPGELAGITTLQQGAVGDISASRKVKVPEIPMNQIGEYYAARKPFPRHWGNSLYLEWYSERNGRVVIESANYVLKIVGDSTWDMTADDEEKQRQSNSMAITDFMERLGEASAEDTDPVEDNFIEEDDGKSE